MQRTILVTLAALTMGAQGSCTPEQELAAENAKALLCDPCESIHRIYTPNCDDIPEGWPCDVCIPLEEGPIEWEPPLPEDVWGNRLGGGKGGLLDPYP